MTVMDIPAVETSTEVGLEELRYQAYAHNRLKGLRIDVNNVFRAWDAWASDRTIMIDGTAVDADLIIYLDSLDQPMTALISKGYVQIEAGW